MRLLLSLVLLCSLSSAHNLYGQRNALASSQKVGSVTRDYTPAKPRNWRGVADHTLHVTVWYPAPDTAVETLQTIGPPGLPGPAGPPGPPDRPLFEAGSSTPHAPFAPSLRPFPLILLSHGTGGSAAQMAWLGTAFARAGFIAAAVDHPGNNNATGSGNDVYTPAGFLLWWERATDLTDVLDGLLADPELAPHIDRSLIGAAGYALGGYTVLELGGAQTDIGTFYDLCRTKPDDAVCHVPEMRDQPRDLPHDHRGASPLLDADGHPRTFEQLLATVRKTNGESLARSGESYRDPRIKAVFAIAPVLGFTFSAESLSALRLPVAIVAGAADTIAPAASSADGLRADIRGAKETTLPGVGHYEFLDTCTAAGKLAQPRYCADPPGIDRDAVHAQTSALAIQFFLHALRLR